MNLFSRKNSKPAPAGEPEPLIIRTDIHSHLCPGIDDGVESPAHGAELVAGLGELGVERMVITPHVTADIFENNIQTVDRSLERLKAAMADMGVTMDLYVSGEYRIDDLLLRQLRNGEVRPLPGDYLLVENPWISEPPSLLTFMSNLRERYGYKPILAHPERYHYYVQNPHEYQKLRNAGIRFQINLLSLAGYYGRSVKGIAEYLLDSDMVEFVGTDMHHKRHMHALRAYLASPEYKKLRRKESKILNDRIFYDA